MQEKHYTEGFATSTNASTNGHKRQHPLLTATSTCSTTSSIPFVLRPVRTHPQSRWQLHDPELHGRSTSGSRGRVAVALVNACHGGCGAA